MAHCHQCGTKAAENEVACSQCGTSLEVIPAGETNNVLPFDTVPQTEKAVQAEFSDPDPVPQEEIAAAPVEEASVPTAKEPVLEEESIEVAAAPFEEVAEPVLDDPESDEPPRMMAEDVPAA